MNGEPVPPANAYQESKQLQKPSTQQLSSLRFEVLENLKKTKIQINRHKFLETSKTSLSFLEIRCTNGILNSCITVGGGEETERCVYEI